MSVWACTGSWRAPEPGSARCSPVSEAGAAPQILRVYHFVGEVGTGLGCTAGPSLLGGWWPLGYPARNTRRKGVSQLKLKLKLKHILFESDEQHERQESTPPPSPGTEESCPAKHLSQRETDIISHLSSH